MNIKIPIDAVGQISKRLIRILGTFDPNKVETSTAHDFTSGAVKHQFRYENQTIADVEVSGDGEWTIAWAGKFDIMEQSVSTPHKTNPASEQFRDEVNRLIHRYGHESELTVCETLGVLELLKAELIERLRTSGPENDRVKP